MTITVSNVKRRNQSKVATTVIIRTAVRIIPKIMVGIRVAMLVISNSCSV